MHQVRLICDEHEHRAYAITTTYIVEQHTQESGRILWSCSCPAYRHKHQECKHIRNVKASKEAQS